MNKQTQTQKELLNTRLSLLHSTINTAHGKSDQKEMENQVHKLMYSVIT